MNAIKRFETVMVMLGMMLALVSAGQSGTNDGWRSLFNGANLSGWEFRGGGDLPPTFNVEDGMIVGRTLIPRNNSAFLATKEQFKDFELVFEVKIDEGLNSGVQVRSTPEGMMRGAQVEIESGSKKTGYIFGQGMGTWLSEDLPEKNEASIKNKWNKFRVIVHGNNIKTWINGKPVADLNSNRVAPEGVVALQVHGYPRGKKREQGSDKVLSVAWKNIKVRSVPVEYSSIPDKKMNVLFLVSDDLNTWLLGDTTRYTGKVVAPNLTKLAESGIKFGRAYTAAPVCSPSRSAFFSGVAPWKSGHYHNTPGASVSEPLNNALSLAGFFKKAGYTTTGYGKITHGWDQKEHWDEKIGHKRDPAPPGAPLTSVGRGEQDWGPIHLAEEDMNDTQGADRAIAQLQKKHDKPFFIAYGTFNPHMPWYVPQKYFDMFPLDEVTTPEILTNDLDDVPPLGVELNGSKGKYVDAILEHGLHKEGVRGYLATTAYADAQIGRVLDALDKSPYRDNTIVVFLSDHGFHLGEKHHWQKATLWEEATHCLLMMRVPGVTPADGDVCHRFVSLLDIYPTLAELCGLDAPDYLDGSSMVPLLKNPDAQWESTAITGLTSKGGPKWLPYVTIRNEMGRYIRYKDGQEEFYDTRKDPHEWTNEIENPKYGTLIKKMKAAVPSLSELAVPMPNFVEKKKK